jgi:hypothetical protein
VGGEEEEEEEEEAAVMRVRLGFLLLSRLLSQPTNARRWMAYAKSVECIDYCTIAFFLRALLQVHFIRFDAARPWRRACLWRSRALFSQSQQTT